MGFGQETGEIAVRAEAVVDRLLTHAAEALIRKPSRRPNWLPKSFPMNLDPVQETLGARLQLCGGGAGFEPATFGL